jgi:hypothetical protein
MIDRTIKRLVQIKTMKQLYGQLKPKLVTGVTIESAAEQPIRDQPGLGRRGTRPMDRGSAA